MSHHDRRWSVRAGAMTGSAHLRAADGCQDAYAVAQHGELLLVSVADGCSSAAHSAAGASLAALLGLRIAEQLLRPHPLPASGAQWRRFLDVLASHTVAEFGDTAAELAEAAGAESVREFASTLIVVACAPPWIAVLSIGDGTVVSRSAPDHLDVLLPPDTSTGDASRTTFVTSTRALQSSRRLVARIPQLDGVAVCTDGLDEMCLEFADRDVARPAPKFLPVLFRWTEDRDAEEVDLLRLLVTQDIATRTEDDRTIVLAVRSP